MEYKEGDDIMFNISAIRGTLIKDKIIEYGVDRTYKVLKVEPKLYYICFLYEHFWCLESMFYTKAEFRSLKIEKIKLNKFGK